MRSTRSRIWAHRSATARSSEGGQTTCVRQRLRAWGLRDAGIRVGRNGRRVHGIVPRRPVERHDRHAIVRAPHGQRCVRHPVCREPRTVPVHGHVSVVSRVERERGRSS